MINSLENMSSLYDLFQESLVFCTLLGQLEDFKTTIKVHYMHV
jgi:hypothetical protein